jgi:mannose-6-phosphate isomerase
MQQRFIDRKHGVMMEKPLGAVDNWFEPGHQFDGSFCSSPRLLRDTPLHASLTRAFAYAEQKGVDNLSGAVSGMLAVDGSVRDGTQRIWAQAEYLRALTLRPSAKLLQRQLQALQQHFLHAKGWNECLDANGA